MSMKVQCNLCPKECLIDDSQSGDCRIRMNIDGELKSVVFSHPCAIHMDPIEKKPLFHFLPGSKILSIATVGCNLHCLHCQNWEISQANPEESEAYYLSTNDLISLAQKYNTKSIAYTYTEPLAFYEYTLESSRIAHQNSFGIKNVLVTAAYINKKPLQELLKFTDAANIDVKAFSERFYRDICKATLKPVLDALILTKEMGVHVEVTYLIIPTLNDDPLEIKNFIRWFKDNLGVETPLHFSRFHPNYKLTNLPPTPAETLDRARNEALTAGLKYVYIGNLYSKDSENTFCGNCSKLLIERNGYTIISNILKKEGVCPYCNHKIYGVWK
ncbi:MAG: AmmeMemoRadiSam system radical SAM enzyme [Oligoflexia bacterium]|nr:AmmeMemoRadiSam system radical SAM enzyme [Oligoflexia bacterium]